MATVAADPEVLALLPCAGVGVRHGLLHLIGVGHVISASKLPLMVRRLTIYVRLLSSLNTGCAVAVVFRHRSAAGESRAQTFRLELPRPDTTGITESWLTLAPFQIPFHGVFELAIEYDGRELKRAPLLALEAE